MSAAAQADASTSPARPAASLKSSSWRRRQQQLRSSQRFVVKSIQMARAASTHHTGHGSTQSSDNEFVAFRDELKKMRESTAVSLLELHAQLNELRLEMAAVTARKAASACSEPPAERGHVSGSPGSSFDEMEGALPAGASEVECADSATRMDLDDSDFEVSREGAVTPPGYAALDAYLHSAVPADAPPHAALPDSAQLAAGHDVGEVETDPMVDDIPYQADEARHVVCRAHGKDAHCRLLRHCVLLAPPRRKISIFLDDGALGFTETRNVNVLMPFEVLLEGHLRATAMSLYPDELFSIVWRKVEWAISSSASPPPDSAPRLDVALSIAYTGVDCAPSYLHAVYWPSGR